LLRVEGLTVRYGNIVALHGVDLEVAKGSTVALIGANGAGKTTLLKAISGLVPVASGTMTWAGTSLGRLPAHRIVALGISHIPEGRRVFPGLTVLENLRVGAKVVRDRRKVPAAIEQAFEMFPLLKSRARQQGGTLSGGEQQMLAIARALVCGPSLLLLDEPSLGLAPIVVEAVFDTIRRIAREGVTILLVEQNAFLALEVADRAYVLRTGEILLAGEAHTLAKDPTVQSLYLGAA